jgi:hypothetical protein
LLVAGADINYVCTCEGIVLLNRVARATADTGLVQLLIEAGADPTVQDYNGFTAADECDCSDESWAWNENPTPHEYLMHVLLTQY